MCWLEVSICAERLDVVPSLVFILPWSFASLGAINASFRRPSPVPDNQRVPALSFPPLLLHHALSHNAAHLFRPQQESQHRVLKELNWQVPNPWIIARYSHDKSKLHFLFRCSSYPPGVPSQHDAMFFLHQSLESQQEGCGFGSPND